jgi:hypothetical protein
MAAKAVAHLRVFEEAMESVCRGLRVSRQRFGDAETLRDDSFRRTFLAD